VLRIRDVYPGSRIRIKEFKYFYPKIVSKLSEIWSGSLFIPLDTDFLPIPDPGVKKGTGSRIPDPEPQHWTVRTCANNGTYAFFGDSCRTVLHIKNHKTEDFLLLSEWSIQKLKRCTEGTATKRSITQSLRHKTWLLLNLDAHNVAVTKRKSYKT
jgi:hypothetical protein